MNTQILFPPLRRTQRRLQPATDAGMAYRLELRRFPEPQAQLPKLMCDPAVVAQFLYTLGLAEAPEERFYLLCLDTRNTLIAYTEVSRGTVDRSTVHPREVFRFAILAGASRVFIAHNHPSGDVSPSPQDLKVTEGLQNAGNVVGIELLDHLIVGHSLASGLRHYASLRERGQII